MENKQCSKCKEFKLLNEFHKNKRSKDGHRFSCKACRKLKMELNKAEISEKRKDHYNKNKERIKKKTNEYYHQNKEKCMAKNKEYQKNHPEQRKVTCRKWQQNNPEKVKKSARRWFENNTERSYANEKRWRKANPETCRVMYRNNNAKRKKAYGVHYKKDIAFLFELQESKCLCCNKEISRAIKNGYHVDHIIPITRCGRNDIINLQLLCPRCNMTKNNKIIDYRGKDHVDKVNEYFKKEKKDRKYYKKTSQMSIFDGVPC